MAKKLTNPVLDALLNAVAQGNKLTINTAEPANGAAAVSGALAEVSLVSGDFSIAAGSPDGRTLTIAQKSVIPVTVTGSATHVSIVNGTDLLAVTTTTPQTLTSGNTVTVPAWTIRVASPV